MTIRAVLFDLDDTLVAFDAVTTESWRQVCTEYHGPGCSVTLDSLLGKIRESSEWYWSDAERHRAGRANLREARRTIVAGAFEALGLPSADVIPLADRYSQVRFENMYLLEGATATLERLQSDGYALALVTNGDSAGQREKIDRFGLADYFEAILVEGELGFGKPDQRVYARALSLLRVSALEACMVGDNFSWDVEAPQSAGMKGIWVDRNGKGTPKSSEAPWRIVRKVSEVPEILRRERDSGS